MIVSILGGLLGILMMIPLRRAFIVKHAQRTAVSRRHGLRGGADRRAKRGRQRRLVFIGFFIAFVHKFLMNGVVNLMREAVGVGLNRAFSRVPHLQRPWRPELLGVGYIIGAADCVGHDGRRRDRLTS